MGVGFSKRSLPESWRCELKLPFIVLVKTDCCSSGKKSSVLSIHFGQLTITVTPAPGKFMTTFWGYPLLSYVHIHIYINKNESFSPYIIYTYLRKCVAWHKWMFACLCVYKYELVCGGPRLTEVSFFHLLDGGPEALSSPLMEEHFCVASSLPGEPSP